MPEEKEPVVRRRSSFGLLISFLFVISLIVTIVVLLNRNTATTLSEETFVNMLGNDNIVTVYEVMNTFSFLWIKYMFMPFIHCPRNKMVF